MSKALGLEKLSLDLLELEEKISKSDMIKVNFIKGKTCGSGATTNPVVVDAPIKFFSPRADNVFVAESDATTTNADKASINRILEVLKENGARFLNLSKVEDRVKIPVDNPEMLSSIAIPKIFLKSYIMNDAKFKTNTQTGVSLGMKICSAFCLRR
ncbi:MAG: DUF362 domain-containing protein [Thermoproteota archaeon]